MHSPYPSSNRLPWQETVQALSLAVVELVEVPLHREQLKLLLLRSCTSAPSTTREFQPFGFIQSMSLRGIDGIKDDIRDCSFLPLYILSNMGLKPVITKLLGFTPPRSAATKSAWEQANEVATHQQERRS